MSWFKSWQAMVVYFLVVLAAAGGLLAWGLTHDDEPGLMETAPRWDRAKFPLRACIGPDDDPEDLDEARAAIRVTNERLGFEALRLLPQDYHLHDGHDCLVILDLHEPLDMCEVEGGATSFSYRAQGANEWRGLEPPRDAKERQEHETFMIESSGTHTALVSVCEVGVAEERSLVLQHELGHVLGLAHDPGNGVSIMQPTLHATPDGEFPPRIDDHDRKLLRELYGPR